MSDIVYMKIKENESLIYKLASRYKDYYNIDDLYQAGCVGIIKACKNYNESNAKFSTYAYKYILGEIIDFIRKDKNIIISDETYNLYKKYLKIKDLLCEKNQREVSFHEICKYMNIDEQYMLRIIESVYVEKSEEKYDSAYIDIRDNIDTEIMIENELDNLDEYERDLIKYRYYMGYSQDETANILGVNQVKVSRNEKLILKKIKDNITN